MKRISSTPFVLRAALPAAALLLATSTAPAQQTLGGLTGTVTDTTGAATAGGQVQLTGETNGVTQTARIKRDGTYQFLDLPVGAYTLVFTLEGFETERIAHIPVQENRTGTINARLKPGSVSTTVDVTERPLLDTTDATNGTVFDNSQIESIPLATGSFTRAATLTPGVNSELLGGIGTNAGLGNQPIWANGQRDTSNGFAVNGVDVTNLFNGKSSSEDNSQRYAFNIGQGGATGGQQQTNTSVYGSNGNGLATPPPEFIQELRVNTSEYDAQQGNRSGAQIDVSTATGGNKFHGQGYGTRATNFANAAPYFNKQGVLYQDNLPLSFLVPQLHRDTLGGTLGGPIVKNKLFFFLGFQQLHDADSLKGYSSIAVPAGLSDDRSTTGILNAINSYNALSTSINPTTNKPLGTATAFNGTFDPVALNILQAKLPNGGYLIPSAQNSALSAAQSSNVFLNQGSLFRAQQLTGALDYNASSRDRVSAKYYYQHAPDLSPFTNSSTEGFPATEDTGAQVGSLSNSLSIGSKINWEQRIGFSRQKVYSTYNSAFGNNTFGVGFPGAASTPALQLQKFSYSAGSTVTVGPNSNFSNAGYFQNRLVPSTNLIFTIGKHNLSIGSNYSYTQLNVRNRRANLGNATTGNFVTFVEGQVTASSDLTGNANRYYRTNEVGSYVQDQWRALPNLSITAGLRYDYDGGFTEKYGNIFSFNPALFNVSQTAVINDGFVVAGNNRFSPTPGTSNSTLTGRQWGISPRLGFAYTPPVASNKLVVRGSFGTYYDRGEYFSYLSQPAGGTIGGPFGATEAPPLVNYVTGTSTTAQPRTLENPLGATVIPASSSDPSAFASKLPTAAAIRAGCGGVAVEATGGDCGVQPLSFAAYARDNKLPYTIDYALNLQYQLNGSTVMTLGYTGNLGRHLVIPVPFNQPGIATAANTINGETSSYGYEVLNTASPTKAGATSYNPISTEPYDTYDGGNIDLRVPYVGYSPNAALFKAAGISEFNALEFHLDRRLTHHVSAGVSYTFSHALDEQSDVGLFFTGDNPNNLRDSYAKADFDRTHVLNFNYVFQLPNFKVNHLLGSFVNGWQLVGITTLQSGQPYSIYEFDGAVGSIYFGNFPTLANPVLGIKNGANPKSALTGQPGSQLANVVQNATNTSSTYSYVPAINVNQLQINNLAPGQKGIPLPTGNEPSDIFENDFTPGQRNIFRQGFQKDADASLQKQFRVTERFAARYTFDVYNLTNSFSPDVPNNSATVSASRLGAPTSPTARTTVGYGQVATNLTQTSQGTASTDYNALYALPAPTNAFGSVRNAISLPRTIEMSLHLVF